MLVEQIEKGKEDQQMRKVLQDLLRHAEIYYFDCL